MLKMAFWQVYVDKGSNRIVFCLKSRILGKKAVFLNIMTIATDLAISNSMSSFVPKYWLNLRLIWYTKMGPLKYTYMSTPGLYCNKEIAENRTALITGKQTVN